jgi:quercetin dioxygenase-like cupin family protein
MRKTLTWSCALLLSAHGLAAQALPPDSLFDRLVGHWVLRGTIARQQTTHDVTFEWMLGREYVQMHEVSRERAANGSPAYEAIVLFGRDPKTGEYGCLWLDNTAATAFDPAGTGRGRVTGDSISFLFNYTATDRFHTTFVYNGASDSWQWHMDNDSAGVRRPFARVTLTRPVGNLPAQVPATAGHEHLTEVACVDVPPSEKRPEFGCFNVGRITGLHFSQASVYWHLRAFPSRKAAEAARSATGIVVEEDGRVWLSEFGPRNAAPRGGKAIAVVGPLQLPTATSYAAVLSYAVMRPGDNSRVHVHPGPEGWYVLAGEQCLETPAGATRARAGGTMTVRSNIPMELNVTGTTLRRAFALVIHDSARERGAPSDWKPSGACSQ